MDIKCVICGEPYEAWGVNHGDMTYWEANLFRKGAGCPSCEGDPPNGKVFEPESIFDVDNGDEDPQERLIASEAALAGKAPKWERPEPEEIWACACCGHRVVRDIDAYPDGLIDYDKAPLMYAPRKVQPKKDGPQWYRVWIKLEDREVEEPTLIGEHKICEVCVSHCDDCGAAVCDEIADGDPYNPGWSTLKPGSYNDVLCIACYEKYCSKCESDECECLGNVMSDIRRKYKLGYEEDDEPEQDHVYAWLRENGKGSHGEEIKQEEVEQAYIALGFLVEGGIEEEETT